MRKMTRSRSLNVLEKSKGSSDKTPVSNKKKYCGKKNYLCRNIDCKICFNKSFGKSDKAKYWSDKNVLQPHEVFISCNKKFFFNCECGHEFYKTPNSIDKNEWCGFCGGRNLCKDYKCKQCYHKSFMSNKKAKFWSKKNKISPREVTACSSRKFYFDCKVCGHEIYKSLSKVSIGRWCGFCNGRDLCENSECNFCLIRSFENSKKAKYWSKKNILTPRQVRICSNKKFYFECEKGHEFYMTPANIKINRWCKFCVNKTEEKMFKSLSKKYPTLIHNYRAEWCKNKLTGRILPFDFSIPELKILLELDGDQHFSHLRNWGDPKENHIRDVYKMKIANKNGYRMIRILQMDVYNDKYDWMNELITNIEKLSKTKKIKNKYICGNNEYDIFKEEEDL